VRPRLEIHHELPPSVIVIPAVAGQEAVAPGLRVGKAGILRERGVKLG
jgi:hypothetical protein